MPVTLNSNKNNKLNVEDDLEQYLTKLEQNIDNLSKQKQAHQCFH